MSEADTPNNEPISEPTASSDGSADELSDVTETSENLQIVRFSELPELKPAVQPWKPEETTEIVSITGVFSTDPDVDEVASESTDTFGQRLNQDADWFALAQKMRQRNRRLLDQVTQLRAALKQKQEALNAELTRSQQRETQFAQQTEELNTLHEQLARLFNALESSHQASQRQQILIETLSEQLQSSQERIAQLERECALTQQRHNEQSHQLLQAANTCRELRTRLQRQQRQTLQFKAALEKSLEMPASSPDTQQRHRSGNVNQPFVPKVQPIQPWSAEPELVEETSSFDTLWKRPVKLEPTQPVPFSQTESFEVRRIEEVDFSPKVDASDIAQTTDAPSEESAAIELELEQQLLAEMSALAEAAGLPEVESDLADTPADVTVEQGLQPEQSKELTLYRLDAEDTPLAQETRELEIEVEVQEEQSQEDFSDRTPQPQNEVVLPQSNWPSPTLYPLRPPKKRKSLAAIDLPSFPRFYPS
jgi:hypothetical protein